MSRKSDSKTVGISAQIDASLHAFLDELHWERRMPLSGIIGEALIEYAAAKGFNRIPKNSVSDPFLDN